MSRALDNDAPLIHNVANLNNTLRSQEELLHEKQQDVEDPIDALEVYNLLKDIRDPEHPNTLEELRVVRVEHVTVDEKKKRIAVQFTPTVPHCSMTTLIGLCIVVKLKRTLPIDFRLRVLVTPGSHEQEQQVNKQLADKERVCAALESNGLVNAVDNCLRPLKF